MTHLVKEGALVTVAHDVPTRQLSVSAVTPPSASPRLVAAVVRGQRIAIPCFDWCVVDHTAESLADLSDLAHYGARISLPVPQFSGAPEHVLIAYMAQWPFARDEHRGLPYVALEACDDGDVTEIRKAAAQALADQIRAHAAALDTLADQLPESPA
ncbi:DUF6907 domain-containing protein [Streptomyces malaysiensis]|uniref:DUF6907 domain-containing protein n=1 Tax=Streptomyces malaysiensis TaxID=92644 RepID=UPI0036939AB6